MPGVFGSFRHFVLSFGAHRFACPCANVSPAALRKRRYFRFRNCRSYFRQFDNAFPQTPPPNVACEEDLNRCGKRHGEQRTYYPANYQTPDEDRDDHRHRMQPDIISNNSRSEEHTSELQSLTNLVCRLLLEKKKKK